MDDYYPMGKLEIKMRRNFTTDALEIYLLERKGHEILLAHMKPVGEGTCELVFELISEFAPMGKDEGRPTFEFPRSIADILLEVFSEFALGEGIKPTRHERLEGTMEAQSAHLADVRRLLGKVMKIELPEGKIKDLPK